MRVKPAKEKAETFDACAAVEVPSVCSYQTHALTFKGPLIVITSIFVFFHQGSNVAALITQKTVFVLLALVWICCY